MAEIIFLLGRLTIFILGIYQLILVARMVIDWVRFASPTWRPRGVLLVLGNLVYSLTDPPLRAIRKIVPPLRIGSVAIDLGFIVLFILLSLGMNIIARALIWIQIA